MPVLPLGKDIPADPGVVGGKAANLIALLGLGLPVPRGLVITTEEYAAQADRLDLRTRLLPGIQRQDWAAVEQEAQELFAAAELPEEFRQELADRWQPLRAVAVRSSASAEDRAQASFAGQYGTWLDVQGEQELFVAVRRCWASLWSRRALAYRRQRAMDPFSVRMAVLVQEMVPADLSGVLFTRDPVRRDPEHLCVEVGAGLGEAMVSGALAGQVYRLDRRDLRLVDGPADHGLADAGLLARVGELALRAEAHFQWPQDVEFAVRGKEVFLLQARPMTAWGPDVPGEAPDPGRPSFLDRMMKPYVDERYAVAPRPLDNILFTRLVGAQMFVMEECGAVFDPGGLDRFRRQIWRPAYRLPRVRRVGRALLGELVHRFRRLRPDWLAWWDSGPRQTLLALSGSADIAGLEDGELLARADQVLSVWEGILNRRISASIALRAEGLLQCLTALAVGWRRAGAVVASLMTGLDNPTVALNARLWELSRLARRSPEVLAAVRDMRPERLRETPEGERFLAAFDGFLEAYGHREGSCWYLTVPTWKRDPRQVWGLLRSLVEAGQRGGSPEEVGTRREEDLRRVEGRLRYVPGLLALFRWLLSRLRPLHAFRETSHFDLTRPLAVLQDMAAEWGARLEARGLLHSAEDVGYAAYEEVRDWLQGRHPPVDEIRALILRRRAVYREVNASWQAERFAGKARGGALKGIAASPGAARGKVRIIRGEQDFDQLQAGEVLVSLYTNPAWTPLFTMAVAVVTETGGASSHAAIVAREYGIPAVMAVAGATRALQDGQEVLVDGSRGLVFR
jgi:pyruvate,water dikinase